MISPEFVSFFSYGELGPIQLGMTQSKIERLLGSPENVARHKKQNWIVLKYGRVEFTIYPDRQLTLIALNFYDMKPEEHLLSLPLGLFNPTSPILLTRTRSDFLKDLDSLKIPNAIDQVRSNEDTIIWKVGAFSEVVFDTELGMIVEAFTSSDRHN